MVDFQKMAQGKEGVSKTVEDVAEELGQHLNEGGKVVLGIGRRAGIPHVALGMPELREMYQLAGVEAMILVLWLRDEAQDGSDSPYAKFFGGLSRQLEVFAVGIMSVEMGLADFDSVRANIQRLHGGG